MLESIIHPFLLVGILGTYALCVVVYRLLFHPLARFPGPKLAAATRWYEGWYDFMKCGQYTEKIAEMHEKYGPIVRISPYELHINDPSYYETLFRQSGHWEKQGWTYRAFGVNSATICTVDHETHRRRRAALNSFFSKAAVVARKDLLVKRVEQLSDSIAAYTNKGSVLNLGVAFTALTTDISTEINLGESYGNLDRENFNPGMTDFNQQAGGVWQGMKHVPGYAAVVMTKMMVKYLLGSVSVGAFFEFMTANSKRTKQLHAENLDPEKKRDRPVTLVDQIMQSSHISDADKSLARVNDDLATVVGAGVDTVAQTLRIVTYWVYSNPAILQRLRDELRESETAADGDWNISRLEQLPYLTSVIMEGLRLNPGIVTRTARISPDSELRFEDWSIPSGTPVGMTVWLMHTNKDLYPDPHHFNPDRWTDLDKRRMLEKTFAPFSRGTRNCLGQNLAWTELYLTISMLISRFDFEFVDTKASDVEAYRDGYTPSQRTRNGVKVHVKPAKR